MTSDGEARGHHGPQSRRGGHRGMRSVSRQCTWGVLWVLLTGIVVVTMRLIGLNWQLIDQLRDAGERERQLLELNERLLGITYGTSREEGCD